MNSAAGAQRGGTAPDEGAGSDVAAAGAATKSGAPPPPPHPYPHPLPESAGRTIDAGRGRVFPCEQCGAELVFNIEDQRLKCPHCGFEKEIVVPESAAVAEQDLREMLGRLKAQAESGDAGLERETTENHVRCEGCGATIVFVGTLTSVECPYCGDHVEREHVHTGGWRIPVDGLLAFAVPRERAAVNLSDWVRSRWFAPNDFLERGASGKFNGVYLPFWTFDALVACVYAGQRGEHYWETVRDGNTERQERRTRWWPASGHFRRFFDDVLVFAARGIRRDLVDSLEPWPLKECRPFSQEVLAGFVSRTYDVDLEEAFGIAKQAVDAAIEVDVRQRIGGDEQRIDEIRTRLGAITFKHILLPVWMLAYRYRDRTYQVLVNACTGEVDGERPYSPWKIFLTVAFALITAVGVFYLAHNH